MTTQISTSGVTNFWRGLAKYQNRLRILTAITISATVIISFTSIQHLADSAGFGAMSWLFPVCFDAVGAVGFEIWMRRAGAHFAAMILSLVAIMVSLAANVTDHWLTAHSVLAAILGAAPPAALGAQMFVLHRHGQEAQALTSSIVEQDEDADDVVDVEEDEEDSDADDDAQQAWIDELNRRAEELDNRESVQAALGQGDKPVSEVRQYQDAQQMYEAARQKRVGRPRRKKRTIIPFEDAVRGPSRDPFQGEA